MDKDKIEEIAFSLREKLEDSGLMVDRRQTLAIAVLVVLTIAGSLMLYMASRPKPVVVSKASDIPAKVDSGKKSPAKSAEARQLFVHIAGAVVNPGVHRLKEGSRVIDAISVAGGAVEDSDQDMLNLAAKLSDGQRIYVPKKGEAPPQNGSINDTGPPALGGGGKVNINLASMDQLVSLPGVGEVTARRIIEYRSKYGSFKRIDELKKVEGIGNKKYEKLKEEVSVD